MMERANWMVAAAVLCLDHGRSKQKSPSRIGALAIVFLTRLSRFNGTANLALLPQAIVRNSRGRPRPVTPRGSCKCGFALIPILPNQALGVYKRLQFRSPPDNGIP